MGANDDLAPWMMAAERAVDLGEAGRQLRIGGIWDDAARVSMVLNVAAELKREVAVKAKLVDALRDIAESLSQEIGPKCGGPIGCDSHRALAEAHAAIWEAERP